MWGQDNAVVSAGLSDPLRTSLSTMWRPSLLERYISRVFNMSQSLALTDHVIVQLMMLQGV